MIRAGQTRPSWVGPHTARSGQYLAVLLVVGGVALSQALGSAQTPAQRPPGAPASGAALYEANCASCHTGATDPRIPTTAALRQRTAQAIVDALTTGVMRAQGETLTVAERTAIAAFISAGTGGTPTGLGGSAVRDASGITVTVMPTPPLPGSDGRCLTSPPFDVSRPGQWNGWGVDISNTRFQPAAQAGLTAEQVPKLTLKWAFGFPNGTSARAQPTIVGGRLFVGSQNGTVYALDAKTGCTIWEYRAAAAVRTAIVLGPKADGGTVAYFGDTRASAYAIDASTGALIWTRKLDEHRFASVTGTPTLYQNRLYVPLASSEEGQGGNAQYECCTFRGSVAALNIANGEVVWHTYTMEPAKPIGKNNSGTTRYGPSGAGIWSAPTIDVKRRAVYVATGNMYTEPPQTTSDAILALDMDTGKIVWVAQATFNDIFLVGCNSPTGANCPQEVGPDVDFGNSPILARLPNGRDAIVVGQKSGVGWAFDPDNKGAVLWQYKAGRGGALGGMEWGSAVDSERAYFAISDVTTPTPGGLHAVNLLNGERVWFSPPQPPACGSGRGCSAALSAAITVIPGVVFAGGMDGAVRAHSTKDGSIVWQFNTNREFETVNGVKAAGASISQAGPTVADGMVYVSSGYGALGGRPGNVLLAFGVQ
jgi:polyvinyl alcohol dehydrogenase (cytochrome)